MRRLATVAVLVVGSIVAAPEARAQLAFSVAAGASLPMGDAADGLNMGYNATLGVGIKPPLAPLGVRIEGMFNSFDFKETVATDASQRVLGLIANGTLSGPAMPVYLIAGLGMYQSKVTVGSASASDTDFGFNIGGGFNLPLTGFSTFIEVRYHHIPVEGGSFQFVPITVGLKF
jgi:hypothetical protein